MHVTWPRWLSQPFQVSDGSRKPETDKKREDATLLIRQHLRDAFTSGRRSVPNPVIETAWARVKSSQIRLMLALEYPVAVIEQLKKPEKQSFPGLFKRQAPPDMTRAQRVLDRLLAAVPGTPRATTLQLFHSLRPNAFAAGAGRLGVTDALMRAVRDDDELAFVLAHELAHDQHRDNAGLTQATLGVPALLPRLIAMGQTPDMATRIFESELNRLQQQVEREADIKALQLMRAAGFDPQGAVSLLKTLQKSEQGREKCSDGGHPPTPERIKAIQAIIKKTPSG
jgi:Zn-dependent protease with chaperone function